MVRKIIITSAWFFLFCAVFGFFGGMLSYLLVDGSTPDARSLASRAQRADWGMYYTGTILALSLFCALLGARFKLLPGLAAKSTGSGTLPRPPTTEAKLD